MAGRGYGFTRRNAERIGETVKWVEREIKNPGRPQSKYPVGGGIGATILGAETPAGGIPAQSGLTPGSATCAIYTFNGASWVSAGRNQIVFNAMTSAAVGAGKFCLVGYVGTSLFVLAEPC